MRAREGLEHNCYLNKSLMLAWDRVQQESLQYNHDMADLDRFSQDTEQPVQRQVMRRSLAQVTGLCSSSI